MTFKAKPRMLVTAKAFKRGKLIATAEGSNSFSGDGVDYLLTTLMSRARFGSSGAVGQRGFNMILSTGLSSTTVLQEDAAPWVPINDPPLGFRSTFRATGSDITGINAVQVRNDTTIMARIALSSLTFTSTSGTNPFVANATKEDDVAWEISWRIDIGVRSMTGLTRTIDRNNLGAALERYAVSTDYINDHSNILTLEYLRTALDTNPHRVRLAASRISITNDPATNTLLIEYGGDGPRNTITRRTFILRLSIRQPRNVTVLLAQQVNVTVPTASGGTASLSMVFG